MTFWSFNNQENIERAVILSPENDKGPHKENEGPASSARISLPHQG